DPLRHDVGVAAVEAAEVDGGLLQTFEAGTGVGGNVFDTQILQDLNHQVGTGTQHGTLGRWRRQRHGVAFDLFIGGRGKRGRVGRRILRLGGRYGGQHGGARSRS